MEVDFLLATLYGVIQGLTEFFPVSSSAHLALLPKVMNFTDPGVLFDLSMHVGTALAVLIYFRKRIIVLGFALTRKSEETTLARQMVVSTIVSIVGIFIFKSWAETFGRQVSIMAVNLIVFGLLMFVADKWEPMKKLMNEARIGPWFFAVMIGLCQSLAIFPGVSRSGVTISAARFFGIDRVKASEYSFLLALPIIMGGFCYKLMSLETVQFDWSVCLYGVLVSFIVGILSIHYFLKLVSNLSLNIFVVYRVILGIVLLAFLGK